MYKEFRIEVYLLPNHNGKDTPYFWVIMGVYNCQWVNTGMCGWADSIDNAWELAKNEWDSYCYENQLNSGR